MDVKVPMDLSDPVDPVNPVDPVDPVDRVNLNAPPQEVHLYREVPLSPDEVLDGLSDKDATV